MVEGFEDWGKNASRMVLASGDERDLFTGAFAGLTYSHSRTIFPSTASRVGIPNDIDTRTVFISLSYSDVERGSFCCCVSIRRLWNCLPNP